MTEGASRPVTDFSEVHLAVSPLDPDHLLASSKFFHTPARYGFYTGIFESFDGGQSWSQMQPPGIEAYSLTSDPVNTFDHLGTGYFTLLTRGPTGLDMIGKPRGGEWQTPVVVDRSTTTDKQWIAGDMDLGETSPYAGRLYMSWTDVGNPSRIVFSHSSDGNQNWSAPPVEIDRGSLQGSIVAVGPDGTVHVVYGDQIFGSAALGQLSWVKSTDGGGSFSAPAKVATTVSIPFQLPNSVFRAPASLPAFAVSPTDNHLYATWSDYATGDADILLARSTDGGASWDPPVRMNDDPLSNGVDQFQPQVSVALDGRVAVAWLDRRMDCPALPWIPESHVGRGNYCIDTFMTRSYDGGDSWEPNLRATAQTWDPSINLPMVDANTGFIGDYIGMASTLDYDFVFFPSTADLGANPRNRQQAFLARIPARAPRQNLVASRLRLDPPAAGPGDTAAVIVDVSNCGPEDARAAGLSLALPESLAYVEGSLSAEAGQARYDAAARSIRWEGPVPAGASVQLRFEARLDSALEEGTRIRLEAHLTDDEDRAYLRVASLAVSRPPTLISSAPADASQDVGPTTVVILRFSEAMDPASLGIISQPALPSDFWQPAWSPDQSSVSLRHAQPFEAGRSYRLEVVAADVDGLELQAGEAPNPFGFTIEAAEESGIYLPWLAREAERP
jgi:uncharacterized repeat protein (TIGR01451 family)